MHFSSLTLLAHPNNTNPQQQFAVSGTVWIIHILLERLLKQVDLIPKCHGNPVSWKKFLELLPDLKKNTKLLEEKSQVNSGGNWAFAGVT